MLGPLKEAAGFDPRLKDCAKSVEEALYGLEDAANTLRDLSDSIGEEPERLESVLDRLDLISRLGKKYGPGIDAVNEHKAAVDAELERLDGLETETASIEAALRERKREGGLYCQTTLASA